MEVSEITEQQLKIAWERLDAAKYLFDGEPKLQRLFDVFKIRFGNNLPYHNQIFRKSEKVRATRITREPKFLERVGAMIEKMRLFNFFRIKRIMAEKIDRRGRGGSQRVVVSLCVPLRPLRFFESSRKIIKSVEKIEEGGTNG